MSIFARQLCIFVGIGVKKILIMTLPTFYTNVYVKYKCNELFYPFVTFQIHSIVPDIIMPLMRL